jgi:putative spermidine/putrescine transport system permease protein
MGHQKVTARRRNDEQQAAILFAPAMLLLLAAYLFPLSIIVSDSFLVNGELSLNHYRNLFATPTFASIAWRTVRFAAITTVGCLVVGYPLAYWLSRMRSRWRTLLLLLVTVPYFTSVLIRTYAWTAVLGTKGLVNRTLDLAGLTKAPLNLVFNETGTLIGMLQVQLPLMVLSLYAVMVRIDRSLLRAAGSLGADPITAFWTVFVPLSRPGVIAGVSLVFTSCLGFYVTPAMLGGPGEYVIAQAIEVRVTNMDAGAASAQATILLAVTAMIMVLFRRSLGLVMPATEQDVRPAARASRDWPSAMATLARAVARTASSSRDVVLVSLSAATLLFLIFPLLIIVPLAFSSAPFLAFPPPGFSTRWFQAYINDPVWVRATWFSAIVATGGAVVATAFGTAAAWALARGRPRWGAGAYLIGVSPLVVPHLVIAAAMFFFLAKWRLVGHPLTFVVTYSLFGLPYVLVVMAAAIQKLDPLQEQAAAILGAGPFRAWWDVVLPALIPAVVSAFAFAFLAGFDDLVAGLFLSSPRAYTLPLRMWDDVRQEISPRIAAVAVLFLSLAIAAVLTAYAAQTIYSNRVRGKRYAE